MYKALTSFAMNKNDYEEIDIRKGEILSENFAKEEVINDLLNASYIEEYNGSIEITQNGTYDVNDYETADVNVSGGGSATLIEKNITSNNTYKASDDNADGYSKVVVNVQPNLESKSITITSNTTTNIAPTFGKDGLSGVEVITNIPTPPPNLQNKQVTISSNTTTTIEKDTGYDGLGTVEVTTALPLETKSVSITSNGTQTITPSTNYEGIEQVNLDVNVQTTLSDYLGNTVDLFNGTPYPQSLIKKLDGSINFRAQSASMMFVGCFNLTEVPTITNLSTANSTAQMFQYCRSLTTIPALDISNARYCQSMFDGCWNIVSVGQLTTSSAIFMNSMFTSCSKLEDVPVMDTSHATNLYNMFSNCPKLTDASLNNILQMCIDATSFTGTKTLVTLGFNSTNYSAARIQALSNYSAFTNAGWTIGY